MNESRHKIKVSLQMSQMLTQRKAIKRQVAVLFLQRILRGRAQQNIMYEGK